MKPKYLVVVFSFFVLSLIIYKLSWNFYYPRYQTKTPEPSNRQRVLRKVINYVKNNRTLTKELASKMKEHNITKGEIIEELRGEGSSMKVGFGQTTSVTVERNYKNYFFFSLPAKYELCHYTFFGVITTLSVLIFDFLDRGKDLNIKNGLPETDLEMDLEMDAKLLVGVVLVFFIVFVANIFLYGYLTVPLLAVVVFYLYKRVKKLEKLKKKGEQ